MINGEASLCAHAVTVAELFSTSRETRARARAAAPTTSISGAELVTRYVFRWNRLGRKGQPCRLIARGTMNSCLLEFDDGFRVVTSRNALRRMK